MKTQVQPIFHFIIILVILLIFDSIWLGKIQKTNFNRLVSNIQGSGIKMRLLPAAIAYLLMGLSIYGFVVPSLTKENFNQVSWQKGALLGFVIYGIYDMTNIAIFNKYTWTMGIMDWMWGTFLFGLTSWIFGYIIFRLL